MRNLNIYIAAGFITIIAVYYFVFYKAGGSNSSSSDSSGGSGSGSGSKKVNYDGRYFFDWIGNGYSIELPNTPDLTDAPGFHIIHTSNDAAIPKTIKDNIKPGDRLGVYQYHGKEQNPEKITEADVYTKQPSEEGKQAGYNDIITLGTSYKNVDRFSQTAGDKNGFLVKE